MKKISKKVLAAALVLTLAVPSAISLAADGDAAEELPKPLALITMQADNLEKNGYKNVAGTEVVEDDKMGTVLHVNASTEADDGVFTDSEASFTNPLVGQDFKEFDVLQLNEVLQAQNQEKKDNGEDPFLDDNGNPIWYKGVMINYWIKLSGTDNGVVLNFRNQDRLQVHKDDYAKYIATKWATQAAEDEAAGKTIDSRFALKNPQTYVDAEGNKYTVYSSVGQWGAFRPDLPANACTKNNNGTIKAHPEAGGDDVNLAPVANMYELYYETDYEKNPKSDARYTKADGFLQTSIDGGLDFKEDTYAGMEMNPNKEQKLVDANVRNNVRWTGTADGEFMSYLTEESDETSTWHMMTVKIQNDSVVYYIDGYEFDELSDFQYFGQPFETSTTGNQAIGNGFCGGWGWKAPYGYGIGNRKDWYGNMSATLLLDWLSLDNTTFSIGGTNLERRHGIEDTEHYEMMADKDGHPERVAEFYIDDIAFYGELLDDSQLLQLYDNGVKKMKLENPDDADPTEPPVTEEPTEAPENLGNGDVDGEEGITSSDALQVLKFAAKLEEPTAEQRAAADTNLDNVINADDALNILKLAAKLIPSLPVQE